MTNDVAARPADRVPRGYRLPDPGRTGHAPVAELSRSRKIYDDALVSGPVSLTRGPTREVVEPYLRPALAVVLNHALPAGGGPGGAARAIGAAFVAVDITDPAGRSHCYVLGELAVRLPLDGPITVWLDGSEADTYLPEEFGDVADGMVRLAEEVGGLRPGQLVVFGQTTPRQGTPARAGTVQVWGPGTAALIVRLVR